MFTYASCHLPVCIPALVSLAGTYTVDDVPNPKCQSLSNYVSDPDHYLTGDEISTINRYAASPEDSTTAQVAVVVLESIDYLVPKEFATELFRSGASARRMSTTACLSSWSSISDAWNLRRDTDSNPF